MTNKPILYTGERLSFYKLIAEKKYKIIIPIIQRDYAQGRKDEETNEVRNEFVDALFNYLDEGIPNRDLDFIYGTLRKPIESGSTELISFIPLDGQQRLTTLFLLHWYLSQVTNDLELNNLFKE